MKDERFFKLSWNNLMGINVRKLSAFNFITLDGYFEGSNGDTSWHRHGAEENEFAEDMLKFDSILLFGRITYNMMVSYWTSPMALENDPIVAAGMNNSEKIVFSRTLNKAEWNNTILIKENIIDEIKKIKTTPGKDMAILGSGSILTQFAEHGLIDEYQFMVDPVVLGEGNSIFKGIKSKLDLRLINSRTFKSGVVLLCYQPMKK
jgi:dihydrofolate reductase